MGRNRKATSFPLYDTKQSPDAEKGQLLLAHNMDKRMAVIVATLPNWGNKGVTVEILREHLNRTLHTNFNHNHVSYALERLFKNEVIGRRTVSTDRYDQHVYYARPSTPARWAKVRLALQGK